MLVIAFDGILFDTLEFRATAVVNALAAEGVETNLQHVLSVLPSHSLAETIRAIAGDAHTDETALDLASLRAQRAIAELGSRGAVLNVAVRERLTRAAAVTRIVVRADSHRRQVEVLLRLAELDAVVSFIRCSDDHGDHASDHTIARVGTQSHGGVANVQVDGGQSNPQPVRPLSVERSYAHITRRLYSNKSLLDTAANIGIALEVGETGRTAARTHGFATPEVSWFRGPLRGLVHDGIETTLRLYPELFDVQGVRRLRDSMLDGSRPVEPLLWRIVSLGVWGQVFNVRM